ncbi:MAG: hypothetical protein ACOYBW_08825 [Fluviibacter phosphoraccumulans]
MALTINNLVNAIHSWQMAGVAVTEFHVHPADYFYLEAEWLRQHFGHPFHITQAMGVKLYVKDDAPRLRA